MIEFPPAVKRLKSIFRGFLIAEIAIFVTIVPLAVAGYMFEPAVDDIATSEELTVTDILNFGLVGLFVFILLPATIVAWIGLFYTRNWARWLYLVAVGGGYGLSIPMTIFDFSYQWGLVNTVAEISALITGCNLSLLFFSEFARSFTVAAQTTDQPNVQQ